MARTTQRTGFQAPHSEPAVPLNEPTYMRVKRAIVADLIGHHFNPGDHLTIEVLTTRYRVSHMPIREALRQLEGEGILVSLAHKGFRIEAISEDYIRNIYDIRVGIESMLARRAAERQTDAVVKELRGIQDLYRTYVMEGDATAAVKANMLFHKTLYAGARNPEAEALLAGRTRVVQTVAQTLDAKVPEDRRPAVLEHERILEAFERCDADACGQAVFEHVTKARDRLLKRLRKSGIYLTDEKGGDGSR
jgi:DNA-binding GntR family transcriptional regulator